MQPAALMVLARAPEWGKVKSRLAAEVRRRVAVDVHRQLLGRTARLVRGWEGPALVLFDGDRAAFAGTGLDGLPHAEQRHAGWGLRLGAALRHGFGLAERTLVVGCDCPEVNGCDLKVVAALLERTPVVLGPTAAGGLWIVAAADRAAVEVVETARVDWDAPTAARDLQRTFEAAGLHCRLGPQRAVCCTRADYRRAVEAGLLHRLSQSVCE